MGSVCSSCQTTFSFKLLAAVNNVQNLPIPYWKFSERKKYRLYDVFLTKKNFMNQQENYMKYKTENKMKNYLFLKAKEVLNVCIVDFINSSLKGTNFGFP